ncbi:hypothetical protein [Pseudonocardia endophytica]|uniref:Uncharacterized protein n=1 Tax=Pseudonocardia endophytica TaxID=401976 RepID=A0A4R1HNV7_PSEEN|nr:hypothetical protein [Pseudonocardia endophytica]TCK21389.1 hypothetical protein EV378_5372 [Pseudonocardia endophytica]
MSSAPFLARPPINRVPTAGRSPLGTYLEHQTRPWGGVPVPVAGPVRATIWFIGVANAGLAAWLAFVFLDVLPCSGPACAIATWGHPVALLVLAGLSLALLAGAAFVTHGLSETGVVPLCVIVVGAGCGAIAVSGLVALVLIALATSVLTLAVVAAVVERL